MTFSLLHVVATQRLECFHFTKTLIESDIITQALNLPWLDGHLNMCRKHPWVYEDHVQFFAIVLNRQYKYAKSHFLGMQSCLLQILLFKC